MPKVQFEVDRGADKRICSNPSYSRYVLGYDRSIPLSEFVDKIYSEKLDEITRSRDRLQESWDKINDKVAERLAEIMQIKWPGRNAIGFMTINRICPRNLKAWSFYVSYFLDIGAQKGIVLHELTHFLYFEKWKQVFPDYSESEFEKPNLIWELSEILVEPIDKDKELMKLVPKTAKAYNRYYSIKINGKESVIDHFAKLYERDRADFGNMLRIAYEEIKNIGVFDLTTD